MKRKISSLLDHSNHTVEQESWVINGKGPNSIKYWSSVCGEVNNGLFGCD